MSAGLAIAAALALAAVAKVKAAGSGSRSARAAKRPPPAGAGPRGSRSAPRFRMVRDVPPGYSTASWTFVRGLVLEDVVDELDEDEGEEPTDDHRLYHVTTNASAVLGSRIKSRDQMRAQGSHQAGLGGGGRDEAAGLVSVTVTLSRARAIRDGLKVMVQAARKEIEPADALIAAMRWNDFPDRFHDLVRYDATPDDEDEDAHGGLSAYGEMMRVVMDTIHLPERDVDEPPTTREGWVRWIEQNRSTLNEEDAYGLVVRFEGAILDTIDLFPDEIEMCANGVGFTMPAAQMAKIDTNEIKILLVAAKGAPVDVVTGECELRFWPDQLVVVGVEV